MQTIIGWVFHHKLNILALLAIVASKYTSYLKNRKIKPELNPQIMLFFCFDVSNKFNDGKNFWQKSFKQTKN